jgi:CAAX protease family protein
MGGMLLAQLISLGLSHVLPGKPIVGNKFVQFVINTFTFQGLVLVFIHLFLIFHHSSWRELLGLDRTRWNTVARGLVAAVIILPVALMLNALCALLLTKIHVTPDQQVSMQALQLSVTLGQKIVFGIAAILLAPLAEESMFRGILYPVVKQLGYPRLALFGSSLLFAASHINLMTFLPLFLIALVFVWLLETTDTLIAPILAHASFNAANFVIYINEANIERWWNEFTQSTRAALGW